MGRRGGRKAPDGQTAKLTASRLKTKRSVGLGDAEDKITHKYGPSMAPNDSPSGYRDFWYYLDDANRVRQCLAVLTKDGKIIDIEVYRTSVNMPEGD